MTRLLMRGLGLIAATWLAHGESSDAALDRWLAQQEGLTTWSADVTQIRYLEALTQPLSARGKVWFVAPDQFRWELGSPPQSIALREGDYLLVMSPRLKRAERYPLTSSAPGPMKEALALIDSGFPRNAAEFRKRFELQSSSETNGVYQFQLRPRAPGMRKLLPNLTVEVSTNDWGLAATELRFVDGSRLRNEFSHAVRNAPVAPTVFESGLDATWKVTAPATSP